MERPGDVFVPSWTHGRPAAFDVTVFSPLTREWLAKAQRGQPVTIGAAALAAEQRKLRRHADHCRALGVDFIPLAVDTFGGWTLSSLQALRAIARYRAEWAGKDPGEVLLHFPQALSLQLQRGNADLLNTSCSSYH